MKPSTRHMRRIGAGVALALALLAPTTASAAFAATRVSIGPSTSVAARSSTPTQLVRSTGGAQAAVDQQARGQHGLGRRDAAIGASIALGILLLGIWGDVAIGALIMATAALLGAGAALVSGARRGLRHHSLPESTAPPVEPRAAGSPRRRQLKRLASPRSF